ncbi:MAG: ABC transporter permease subunit [Thermotogota bacterium]
MFLNIFRNEARNNLWFFLIWCAVFIGFIFMYLPMTNLILDQMDELMKFVEKMPEFLLKMFSFEPEVFNKPEGIFGSEGMSFVYILSAVFAANLAGAVFSKEFEQKTIEFLLVKPVSRSTVFFEKAFLMMTLIVLLSVLFTLFEFLGFNWFIRKEYSEKILLSFGIYTFSVLTFFSGLSTLISCITKKSNLNISISIGIIIFMYFGDTLGRSFESVSWLAKMSIFNYIPLADTIIHEKMYLTNAIIISLIGLLFFAAGYFVFRKSDIEI